MNIVRHVKESVHDALELRSIRKHRSRIGWRAAPKYSAYLAECRAAYAKNSVAGGALDAEVNRFRRDGVASFATDETETIAREIFEDLKRREQAGDPVWLETGTESGGRGYAGDLWRDYALLEDLFRGPLGAFLTGYFEAHFRIHYGSLYRSEPRAGAGSGSQLWHSDSGPGICVNVMFYLHPTDARSGGLRALPWRRSTQIYRDEPAEIRRRLGGAKIDKVALRRLRAAYYEERISRDYSDDVVQPMGRAGLVTPFLNNTLHQGGQPSGPDPRYAIVFHCYPSRKPADYERYRRDGLNKSSPYPSSPEEGE